MRYAYLLVAIVSEVVATSFMKESNGFTRIGPSLVPLAGYGIAFYFLSLTLPAMPTGVAYAIWSGVGIVLIAAVAWVFPGQRLPTPALAAPGLIGEGGLVLTLFSKGCD